MSRDPKLMLANERLYTETVALRGKLKAADALAEVLDEILTNFLEEINYVYENATGRAIEQTYIEDIERFRAALRQYREV